MLLVAIVCALLALMPGAAAAAQTVNSKANEPDAAPGPPCSTAAGKCTLQAAIEVTNLAGVADTILFDATVFKGDVGDVIAPITPLPTITAPISVNAGTCFTDAAVNGPCAAVSGPAGQTAIKVEADGVSILDLAIGGATTGVGVFDGSTNFSARGNWVGFGLDGSPNANATGIFVDPNSDGATIGGTEAVQRNVIANNSHTGLRILGASDAVVQGNYFGVRPDGTTAAPNFRNLVLASAPSSDAENGEIGADVGEVGAGTPQCDLGCNVFASFGGVEAGIDLEGSGAIDESGSIGSLVHGNFVGFDAEGDQLAERATAGIKVGEASAATIGAPLGDEASEIAGDANYVSALNTGIWHENGGDLVLRGNAIGIGPDGDAAAAPVTAGVLDIASGLDSETGSTIVDNRIRLVFGSGVDQRFGAATIARNTLVGGTNGIITQLPAVSGTLIEANSIEATQWDGVLIHNDGVSVYGNTVSGAGIAVDFSLDPVDENQIGGDDPQSENVISGSPGDAIEIEAPEADMIEVGRNRGTGNKDLFIDLVTVEPLTEIGPNGGVQPPAIAAAAKTEASGTADPGAKVRLFRKATSSSGEIESFLGEAVADGSGNWQATYAAVPGNTIVTATQTNTEGGTSELSATATTPPDPPVCPQPGATGCTPPLPPPAAPQTTIKKGPKAKSAKTTAKFRFKSSVAGSTFQCKLDKKPFKKCKSPKTYNGIKPGKHIFKVRAVGPTGLVDPTSAKRKFTVLTSPGDEGGS
jgi:hypothetical protein